MPFTTLLVIKAPWHGISVCRLSCLSSVTCMLPTQAEFNFSGIFLHHIVARPSGNSSTKITNWCKLYVVYGRENIHSSPKIPRMIVCTIEVCTRRLRQKRERLHQSVCSSNARLSASLWWCSSVCQSWGKRSRYSSILQGRSMAHTTVMYFSLNSYCQSLGLSLIHIWRCRRSTLCRSRWSPYH